MHIFKGLGVFKSELIRSKINSKSKSKNNGEATENVGIFVPTFFQTGQFFAKTLTQNNTNDATRLKVPEAPPEADGGAAGGRAQDKAGGGGGPPP